MLNKGVRQLFKKESKIIVLALLLILLLSNLISAYAHSGRTDENGGHYDKSTDEYHYHHGYPAHDHSDGVCPYNFDDQTNHSPTSNHSAVMANEDENDKSIKWYHFAVLFVVCVVWEFCIFRFWSALLEEYID